MRLPGLFLACLLLVAALNVYSNARRIVKVAHVPPPLEQTTPTEAFESQINAITDPVELRRLALRDHRVMLSSDRSVQSALATVSSISHCALFQSGIILLLALCVYAFESRRGLNASNTTDRN